MNLAGVEFPAPGLERFVLHEINDFIEKREACIKAIN